MTSQEKKKKKKRSLIIVLVTIVVLIAGGIGFYFATAPAKSNYGTFIQMLEADELDSVTITENFVYFTTKDGVEYQTGKLNDDKLLDKLKKSDVSYSKQAVDVIEWISIAGLLLPIVMIVFIVIFMFKSMGSNPFSASKNQAKRYEEFTGVTFADVAGQEEAKESLREVVDYLENSKSYTDIGAKLPRGVLLVGSPGNGKTLLAKAVAGEANVPFFCLSGADFDEMFVGVGASRVKNLFKDAKKEAPCIIFIDEIDAIGKSRDSQASNDEHEKTLNKLLTEMDGFESDNAIVVLGATNRPEVLDPALLRPGRFDRRVVVDKPDFNGRVAILQVHSKNVKLSEDVCLEDIARATSGAAGADLANIINEGAINAVRRKGTAVTNDDLLSAVEIVFAGKEKKDRVMNAEEKRIVSFHEVGHAVVAALQINSAPVQKITIVPRTTGSLGYTLQIPEEEKYLTSAEDILVQIKTLVGGRCAEEIFCNIVTSGAANDIERATELAKQYVAQFGMSDKFGMVALEQVGNKFLNGFATRACADVTSAAVDQEVIDLIKRCKEDSTRMLSENKALVQEVAGFLLSKENITGAEFMEIFRKYHPLDEK